MRKSTYLSLGLLLAVVGWMLSGAFASVPDKQASGDVSKKTVPRMRVKVLDLTARQITREVVVQGELEPRREVEIRAQTTSRVVGVPVEKGNSVRAGELLARLAEEDRAAQLRRAEAEVSSQRFEVSAVRKLKEKGLQAENRLKAALASLAAAEADREQARLELDYTEVKAPFAGVLEQRFVELGSHLEKGDPVARLVDASVLKAVGYVSQQSAGEVRLGQTVRLRFLDGRKTEGRVTYISRVGDAETHSFRVEAEVPNSDGGLSAGVSAELRIAIGGQAAHFVSPAVLTLDASGAVGVKTVNKNGVVEFYPIALVRTEANGVWVSGLPAQSRVISRGNGFVSVGESVIPVPTS